MTMTLPDPGQPNLDFERAADSAGAQTERDEYQTEAGDESERMEERLSARSRRRFELKFLDAFPRQQ